MRFTDEKLAEINNAYSESQRKQNIKRRVHGLHIDSSIGGDSVFACNWQVCKVDELDAMIQELTDLQKAIREVTGVIC